MGGLPREVHKWLQSLDLTHPVRNTRRDFSNGYLIAEIFSWYFPQEIQMHSFDNGMSIETKMGNWSIIQRFFKLQEYNMPKEEIEGTIHCKPRAAALLVQRIYSVLTNRKIALPLEGQVDFSDNSYQRQLPHHARATATQAIKTNIAGSESVTDPDLILCGQKAQDIIRIHIQNRQQDRIEDPVRFGIKANICEKSPRKLPPAGVTPDNIYQCTAKMSGISIHEKTSAGDVYQDVINNQGGDSCLPVMTGAPMNTFTTRELEVHQQDHRTVHPAAARVL